jgi:hypothetical protein
MPRTATRKRKSLYSVHPGVAMVQKWVAELPQKTGKSLEQWMQYIRKHGPADEKACREWLKNEHALGTNSAWWLAERAAAKPKGFAEEDPQAYLKAAEQYVDDMFTGGKEGLRPIYDKLLEVCLNFADDVKACPCQTIVPIYRNHVIAQIKPSTRTRIDFGFALQDTKATGRLIDTGGFAKKDRITHRIPITDVKEIDAEVMKWFKKAYDMDA